MTPRVLALTRDAQAAIAEIRLARPLRALQAAGRIEFRLHDWSLPRQGDLLWCDLAILQRPTSERERRLSERLGRMSIPWIYEIDDLLLDPAPQLMHRDALLADAPRIRDLLRAASAISTTTGRLAQALLQVPGVLAEKVVEVPNIGWPTGGLPARQQRDGHATLVLASSDIQSLGGLADALALALQDQRLKLLVIGPVAGSGVLQRLPPGRVTALPAMPHPAFVATVAAAEDPLALMPLDDSRFSACKSAVKLFDFGLAGVPAICVDRPPYRDHVVHGQTGWLVADEPAGWLGAIRVAQADAGLRATVARQAREHVRAAHAPARMEAAWLELIQRLAALRGPRPGRLQQLLARGLDALQGPLRAAHAANRRRLRQRRAQPAPSSAPPAKGTHRDPPSPDGSGPPP